MDDVTWVFANYDWDAVLKLLQDSFAYMDGRIDPPSSVRRLTAQQIADFACDEQLLVIENGNKTPVACAFLSEKPDCIYIGKLAVAKRYRGPGYAKQLIAYAEETARNQGFSYLELQTRIELTENHVAFARYGFRKTAEGRHPGFERTTEITMRKLVSK